MKAPSHARIDGTGTPDAPDTADAAVVPVAQESAPTGKTRVKKRKRRRLQRRALREVGGAFVWILVAVGAVAFGLGRWIVATFGYITPDQALMNLQGAGGEGGGGRELVLDAVVDALLIPLGLVVALWVATRLVRRRLKRTRFNRAFLATYAVPLLAILSVPALGAWSLASAVQLKQYLAAGDPSLDLSDYYVEPRIGDTEKDSYPNLVLIYLESVENALADQATFGVNMLEPLQEVTADWDRIETLDQYPGGGWTMSGIVSSQCGIPLRAPASTGVEGTDTTDQAQPLNHLESASYLPGATCLGDFLEEQGYQNVFLGGAYTTFASKGQFLSEHGYSRVLGREQWEEEGETELTEAWGLSDRRLFERAEQEIDELEASGKPYALTLLTLDTHEPAHRFPYCETSSDTALTDVSKCSMQVVADFVNYMESKGFLENTVVVLIGDHLKFGSTRHSYGAELTDYPDRTIFNRFWVPDGREVRVDKIDQLDLYPTILEAMGFELEDGRAGLGVSAFNPNYIFGSLRQLSIEDREAMVRSRSTSFYERMWGHEG